MTRTAGDDPWPALIPTTHIFGSWCWSSRRTMIDPSRNALFDTRLTPIARLSGAANLEDFVNMLKAGQAGSSASCGG